MNDMRKLLSGAFPDPEDEPRLRDDVVGAAMEWGDRRRRRDWMLAGVTALAVVAVGTGIAAGTRGGGSVTTPADGLVTPPSSSAGQRMAEFPPGTPGTENCSVNPDTSAPAGDGTEFCRLYLEEQQFDVKFAQGSVPYIQAALPAGFTVKATSGHTLILSGPGGTNYLFPSVTSASTLDGHTPDCGTTPAPVCIVTDVSGGRVVVGSAPSGGESAGYVTNSLQDPRVTIVVGTAASGAVPGIPAPNADNALLSRDQLAKIMGDAKFLEYARTQWAHYLDIEQQLQKLTPPSASGSSAPWPGTPSPPSPSGSSSSETAVWSSSGSPSGPWWPSSSSTASGPWWPSSSSTASGPGWPSSSTTSSVPGTPSSSDSSPVWPSGTSHS